VSIPVDLAALEAEVSAFGRSALLITTSTDSHPHVASLLVRFEHDELVMNVGRRTLANAARHPAVTLVWPAPPDGGYCLIVDGAARSASPSAETLLVRPTSAVLHRLASSV
jgi:hypothetical protein